MDLIQPPEGQTLESLAAPRPRPVTAPVLDPSKPFTSIAEPTVPVFDPAKPFTPVADTAPVAAPQFDPNAPVQKIYGIEEFSAKPAAELIADKDFMPVQFGTQHESELTPELRTKLEEVYAARETSGTSVKDKAKAFFTGIAPAVKTLAEGAKSAFKVSQKFTPAGVVAEIAKAKTAQDFVNAYAKTGTEAAASVELAALGSTDLLRRSAREVGEGLGAIPGVNLLPSVGGIPVRTAKANKSEGDWRTRLSDDIAAAKQVEAAGAGNGAVMDTLGIDAATLEKDFGIKVDPEEIARLSVVTDPINYVPLGSAVGFVGKFGGKMTRGVVAVTNSAKQAAKMAEVLNAATTAASAVKSGVSTVAGTAAKAVGGAIESVGNVAEKGVRALGGAASGVGLGGLLGGNVYSALGGAAVAKAVPRIAQITGRTIKGAGKILTGEAAAPAALTLAGDTLKAGAVGAVKGAAKGGVLILPFEIGARPEEEEQLLGMVGLGAGIRAGAEGVRPAAQAAGRAVQNKLAETIFKTVEQSPLAESPTYGTDPLLDSNHAANTSKLSAPEQKLVNWGRELLRGAGGEVYVLDTPAFAREAQGNKTARGYAISIGETIAPDGSAKPLFRIFLNRDAEALPHEFFHALTDLDPKRAADFRDTVQKSLTPEQLSSFGQLYNALLNNGLPEAQWKSRLSPEQVVNEVAAETFSRVFLSQDLSGVSPTVQQKAALFVSSLLEKAGAPLAGVNKGKGTPGASLLGVRGSTDSVKLGQNWVKNMIERVNEQGTLGEPPILATRPDAQTPIPGPLVSKKPTAAKPAPKPPTPAPTPKPTPANPPLPAPPAAPTARNIRTPKTKQNDFAGLRAEVTNVEPARAAAEATGDANTIARVTEISDLIESGSPVVEIEHSGVKAAGTEAASSGRSARRAEQEAAYIAEGMSQAPEPIREAYQKVFVPVRWEVVAGKPQLLAMSLDKVIANTHKAVKESAARGVADRIPYEVTDGKLTDNAWGQFVDDLKAYADNQANGYRGDGQKLIRPTEDVGLSIPAENPAYNPRPITEERANFLNLVQGLNPPLTARVGKQSSTILPGNVKGQVLAEVNARTPEVPSVIRPEDITKQEFKNVPGRSVAETNPLRNELAAAGVPVRELIEVTERINAGDINSVRPRPELDFKAPVTDTIRGGFLPGEAATSEVISDVLKMDAKAFNAAAKSWEGGQRNRAYDLGLSTKSPEEVQLLRDAQESASADRKKFMAARDIDNGVASALKAQFFREAYEAATDTGGAAGEIGWRQAFPDRKAPFPEAAPKGDLLPGEFKLKPEDRGKLAEDAGFGNFWLSPDGKFYRVGDHQEWAFERMNSEGVRPKSGERSAAEETLKSNGWVRISREREGSHDAVFLNGYKTSEKQNSAMEIWAAENPNVEIIDTRSLFFGRLPEGNFLPAEPNETIRSLTETYRAARDLDTRGPDHKGYDEVNVSVAKKLAEFYDSAKDSPSDPAVAASYQALADETLAQYQVIKDAGYTIELFTGKGEPYKSSADMVADVRDNKHLYFLKTEGNFTGDQANPMLRPGPDGLLVNDVFRAVHDFFGHAKEGYQFGPRGELNAWKAHSTMFTDAAQGSLAAETLAQNSWVNYGKHVKEGTPLKDRPFAEQKAVVVPDELIAEARAIPGTFENKGGRAARIKREAHEARREAQDRFSSEDGIARGELRDELGEKAWAALDLSEKDALVEARLAGRGVVRGDFMPTGREWEAIMTKRKAEGAKAESKKVSTKTIPPATWILPDGEVKRVTATYHELDLADNSADYNKRFGTKFSNSVVDQTQDRVDALSQGFVRVRYSPENGRTAVEVGAAHWNKQKAAVLDTLLNSADKIDTLKINLIDAEGVALDTVSATIFNADDRVAAITDAVNELVPPTTARAKNIAPTDIQRMRALPGPGDFLPREAITDSGRAVVEQGLPVVRARSRHSEEASRRLKSSR